MCQLNRLCGIAVVTGKRSTLIKHHNNITPDDPLNINNIFRGKNMPGPVNVGFENNPFIRQLPVSRQGKNLVTPAVSKNGPFPGNKAVKAS